MARPEDRVYEGLAQVAHAIRRTGAMYIAMNLLPPSSSTDDLKDLTDDLALHLAGKAGAQEAEEQAQEPSQPLGVPWDQRD